MKTKSLKLLVTGGAGFIGSEFIRQMLPLGYSITVVDKLTYAGDLARLKSARDKFTFYKTDILNLVKLRAILKKERPSVVVHFAAETHVDRSILGDAEFIQTNICGTQNLLKACRELGIGKFIHISTDEVYGEIEKGKFTEDSGINPNSPYSASKASADLLVKAYIRTFNFPAMIVRPSNNYGPWQYPEKFIPVIAYKALKFEKIPVYAQGLNVREWLHISDCARAIRLVLEKGKTGETYNVGSGCERRNIDLVKTILALLDRPQNLITFVKDRPGHDCRYALNSIKIQRELGWKTQIKFEQGLAETVHWYRTNLSWLEQKNKFLKNYWKKVYKF